jgi:DNA-binding response OmpR family regulator
MIRGAPPPPIVRSPTALAPHWRSTPLSDSLDADVQDLRARFLESSAKTLDAFRAIQRQLAAEAGNPEALDALRRELHRVRGTAGSYGFADAARLAAALEERATMWHSDPERDAADRADIVANFIAALADALRAAPSAEPVLAQPILLLADDDRTMFERVSAGASLRGYRLQRVAIAACDAARVRADAARLVLARIPVPPPIAEAAAAAGVPLLRIETRPLDERAAYRPPPGSLIADVVESLDPLFEMTERLLLRTGWSGSTVLAVDDDPIILLLIRALFSGPEFRVDTLDDPSRLTQTLDQQPPSLLLLDISMPGFNGIEMVAELRSHARFRDLPIILLSGATDANTRNAALEAGADEFVAKPIAPAELRARIADRLERQRMSRIGEGLHPATGLALAPRLAREAEAALAHLAERGLTGSVVLFRLAGSPSGSGATAAWLRETGRIARQLAPLVRAAGYSDTLTLCLVLATDPEPATDAVRAVVRALPANTPAWRAGVAPASAGSGRFSEALHAAEDAVDAARLTPDEPVHRWQGQEAADAPEVVLVEDDPALAAMVEYAMRSAGVTFRTFGNGLHALEQLLAFRTERRRPIVLLDVDLPGLDGYSLHERLRAERGDDFDVVFMTVHASEADQLRALKAGAVDYLPKPVNLRVLMAKLGTWIERARHRR